MFPQKSDFASAEWFCPLLPLSQKYQINIYAFWSWKYKKQETIGVLKDRTDMLFSELDRATSEHFCEEEVLYHMNDGHEQT